MAADLNMLLICRLKFNLLSNWISKSSTEGLICLLSITTFSFFVISFFFICYYYLKLVWVYYHLVFLGPVSYHLRLTFQNTDFFTDIFLAKADNLLSSAKLCTDAINMKNNKPFIDRLDKRGPSIQPRGYP